MSSLPTPSMAQPPQTANESTGDNVDLVELLTILGRRKLLLLAGPLLAGVAALGLTFLIAPTFTAVTVFLPPQQQQSAAASALASLGPLASMAGGAINMKSAADQYVSLMQSVNVEDRIIERFKLMDVYEAKYRFAARKRLEQDVRIQLGKKDGLITVEVDAKDPQLAADMANQYVAELRRLTSELALTEAQQRRAFFEGELKQARTRLTDAQQHLQSGGFNAGAIKAEPKAAAEGFARLKAEITAAEIRLQMLRRSLADTAVEVQQQMAMIGALRSQLQREEGAASAPSDKDADYLGRYREFKYQEALFDLFSKQYEMARLDESREGALIQVVDPATPPEYKSKPKRGSVAIVTTLATWLVLMILVLTRHFWDASRRNPAEEERFKRLRTAWRLWR